MVGTAPRKEENSSSFVVSVLSRKMQSTKSGLQHHTQNTQTCTTVTGKMQTDDMQIIQWVKLCRCWCRQDAILPAVRATRPQIRSLSKAIITSAVIHFKTKRFKKNYNNHHSDTTSLTLPPLYDIDINKPNSYVKFRQKWQQGNSIGHSRCSLQSQ